MIPTNIKFYHSGGGGNCDPSLDLGGNRSTCEITTTTLFDDLDGKESRAGLVDYRCFYIKNTHGSDTLRNVKFYIDWERKSGSFIDVGIKLLNDVQTVEVSGISPPNEGDSMILNLSTYGDFNVPYSVNITEWQGQFQTAMRGLDGLQDVQVLVSGEIGFPTDVVFTINFLGQAESRKLQPLTVTDNSLTGQTINIVQTQEGSPVNIVACTIPTLITAPACVSFDYPQRGNPVELGDLMPGDQFPVWLRRTTPENTRIHIRDEVRLNVDGTFP